MWAQDNKDIYIMAHGVTLTLRAIAPSQPRMFWNSRVKGTYRNKVANPDRMPRAKHRNILFGRKAVGNTTPVERQQIWSDFTRVEA